MLRPDADTDQASWNSAQYREAGQHPKGERGLKLTAPPEHARDDSVLEHDLETLCHARGQLPAPLHPPQMVDGELLGTQSLGKLVSGGHRILNGQVDANAADRRHGVRSVADAKQPRAIPSAQATSLLPRIWAISAYSQSNTSCSRKAARSLGANRSRTTR
jgi:hypothetical protein